MHFYKKKIPSIPKPEIFGEFSGGDSQKSSPSFGVTSAEKVVIICSCFICHGPASFKPKHWKFKLNGCINRDTSPHAFSNSSNEKKVHLVI